MILPLVLEKQPFFKIENANISLHKRLPNCAANLLKQSKLWAGETFEKHNLGSYSIAVS